MHQNVVVKVKRTKVLFASFERIINFIDNVKIIKYKETLKALTTTFSPKIKKVFYKNIGKFFRVDSFYFSRTEIREC